MTKLDDYKVVLGQLIRVANEKRKAVEPQVYVALQIEGPDSKNEECVLFTEKEVAGFKQIISPLLADSMVAGRVYPIILSNKTTNIVKISDKDKQIKIVKLSDKLLDRARARADRNQEDVTKKSFLTDLLD